MSLSTYFDILYCNKYPLEKSNLLEAIYQSNHFLLKQDLQEKS